MGAQLSPILGHIHVPKCSGTSFRLLLDDVYPGSSLQLYFDPSTGRTLPTTFVFSDEQVAALLAPESARAFSSHYVRRFPPSAAGRAIRYVTFLRHPLWQLISYLHYARGEYTRISDADLLSHLPPNMPDLSLKECARWLLAHDTQRFLNFRENYTTNFFARYEVLAQHGYDYANPRYRTIRLRVAKQVLKRFFFVGIAERMEDSWRLLRKKLSDCGTPVASLPMRRDNNSGFPREDMSWLTRQDEVGGRLLTSLQSDLNLYRWASRRFALQLEEERRGRALSWWQKIWL